VHALFGVNFYIPRGPKYVQGHKIAVEFGIPLYQSLDGPQLADNWRITFGWQYTLL
jgi:hypothetical protein